MKRINSICLLTLLLILLCGCSKSISHGNFNESASKSVSDKRCEYVYENQEDNTNVKIYYPQIDGLEDINIQTKINKRLKDGALNDYANYWNMDGLMLEINYDISYMSESYISVRFKGIGQSGSYPTSGLSTVF
ncbi:DUF4163 domain-containing protein [Clostridium sp. HBUAS56010]|uniref:DUF4163 domain-containing protein n=1 Tax=Clostridium sp. HBUAS56010 TaxID=2571127 RepID=UPI0011775901|nr:DUF4163 domain-containing protein [Clostridium sp. HBUAS56010]